MPYTYKADDGVTVVWSLTFKFWRVTAILSFADAIGAGEAWLCDMLDAYLGSEVA